MRVVVVGIKLKLFLEQNDVSLISELGKFSSGKFNALQFVYLKFRASALRFVYSKFQTSKL